MAINPWRWREGRNPYLCTPFQILDLALDVKGRGPIEKHIRQRRDRIKNAPERFKLFGEVLDEARVNAAADALRDPNQRLYAELCTHRPVKAVAFNFDGMVKDLEAITVQPLSHAFAIDLNQLARLVPPPAPRTYEALLVW